MKWTNRLFESVFDGAGEMDVSELFDESDGRCSTLLLERIRFKPGNDEDECELEHDSTPKLSITHL